MQWSFCDQDGMFTGAVFSGPEELLSINTPAGCGAVEGMHNHERCRVDIASGQVIAWQPPAPPDTTLTTWSWDDTTERWQPLPTLAAHQAAAWERIKRARTAAEAAPLSVGLHTYDADPQSQQRIAGAVQMAALAVAGGSAFNWEITWTMADNTTASLSATEIIDVGLSLAAQINVAHTHARALRSQIDAAQSLEELNLINWS